MHSFHPGLPPNPIAVPGITPHLLAGCVVGRWHLLQPEIWKRQFCRAFPVFSQPLYSQVFSCREHLEGPPPPQGSAVHCRCSRRWPAAVLQEPRAPQLGILG